MINLLWNGISFTPRRGYATLRTLEAGETRWFASAGREFGLWYLTLHGFALSLSIIGPFQIGGRV